MKRRIGISGIFATLFKDLVLMKMWKTKKIRTEDKHTPWEMKTQMP